MRTPVNGLLTTPRAWPGRSISPRRTPSSARRSSRRQLRQVEVVALPRGVLAPADGRLHRRARARGALEHPQRELERLPLRLDVERPAGRVPEREIAEQ